MQKISFVTGANGHLGNNVVRALLEKGECVKAGVRNLEDTAPFAGLNCSVLYADLLDQESLRSALEGVDTLYQVAAVFQHWAVDPEKEIIVPNVIGTKNIMEAAKAAKIRKIVYVSSVAALSLDAANAKGKIDESTWLNDSFGNAYFASKMESEKAAWKIAKKYDMDMVSVLPGAMVGGTYQKDTPTTTSFKNILYGKMTVNHISEMNIVDMDDVVDGMLLAAEKGIKGTRYILAADKPVDMDVVFQIAKKINPNMEIPKKLSKVELLKLADRLTADAKLTNTIPALQRNQVNLYYGGINRNYDLATSKRDLGYSPRTGEEALGTYYTRIYTETSETLKDSLK